MAASTGSRSMQLGSDTIRFRRDGLAEIGQLPARR